MIERLLAAEKALEQGMLDTAGRLFDQVAQADPRNAIALVGLAKVAFREDRIADARELVEQALAIDPDEAAAQRLLREVYAEVRPAAAGTPAEALPTPPATATPEEPVAPEVLAAEIPAHEVPAPEMSAAPGRSLLARLRRWLFGPRDGS
jgi:Tfp pilus assembly protein PilF